MNINGTPVLTVDEAAEHLRRPKCSLYKFPYEGKYLVKKMEWHWHLYRDTIDH